MISSNNMKLRSKLFGDTAALLQRRHSFCSPFPFPLTYLTSQCMRYLSAIGCSIFPKSHSKTQCSSLGGGGPAISSCLITSSTNKPEPSHYIFVPIDQYYITRSSLLRPPRKHSTPPNTELYSMDSLVFSVCK
jgi:hypothetical protein